MEKDQGEAVGQVTVLLAQLGGGDRDAADPLLALVYGELKSLARRHMAGERAGHTLGATALAHEAYLKLVAQDRVDWKSRAHFMGAAALAMRRILINHAKARLADKRGAGAIVATFDEQAFGPEVQAQDLVRLDEALTELATMNARQAEVVTYRFFVGLGYDEIAEVMGVSAPTVRRDWRFARAWLLRAMGGGEG
ncbi:MAG: sigma-70 family RNA polymerase sigma factor [Myxococcota bacterium]